MNLVFGGINSVLAAFRASPGDVEEAWIARNAKGERVSLLRLVAMDAGIRLLPKSRSEMDQVVGHKNHQGVLCWCKPLASFPEKMLVAACATAKNPALLILEGVTDPRNLGACIRSADACAATGVVIPAARSVGLTPAAIRAAAGSAHRVPLVKAKNLARTIRRLKEVGIWMVGLHPGATKNFYTLDCRLPIAFVLGSEGSGLRRLTAELCDHQVYLPMRGEMESLNVSVAAALCLYEMCRQRGWEHANHASRVSG